MSKLMSEAEDLYFDTGKVEIITGIELPIWEIPIKGIELEFKSCDLVDSSVFIAKYFEVFHKIINLTKREWIVYVNALAEKAQIYDATDYPPYVQIAKDYCYTLWSMVDTEPESLNCVYDDGYMYYVPVETVKEDIETIRLKIDIDVLKRILEKLEVKTEVDFEERCTKIGNQYTTVWELYPSKLKEVAEWRDD